MFFPRHIAPFLTALCLSLAATLPSHAQAPAAAPVPAKTPAVADFRTCEKPEWPRESLRHEEQGTVTLRFLIDVDGSVKESMVAKSSGYPLLDMAAQAGIAKCKFKPGTTDGVARPAW